MLVDGDGRALAGLLPSDPWRFDLYWPLHALRTVRDWGLELRVLDRPSWPADLDRLYPGAGAVLIAIAVFIVLIVGISMGTSAPASPAPEL